MSVAWNLDRRRFLGVVGGVGATLATGSLTACGGGSAGTGDKELVFTQFGGTYEQKIKAAQVDPFVQETGVKVTMATGADNVTKMQAMVKSKRVEWDVIDATGPVYGRLLSMDLVEKPDPAILTKDRFEESSAVDAYSAPQFAYSHCIFWNTKAGPDAPQTWADVWDVKRFPGKRGFQKNAHYLLEIALMADGVPPAQVYPLDIPRALKSLDRIRDNCVFQDLNTIQNLVAQGEVTTGDLNLARVVSVKSGGTPLTYHWNQNIVDFERWVILKDAPNKKAAEKFLAATMNPDRQLKVLESLQYTPTLKDALAKLPADKRNDLAGTTETLSQGLVLDPKYYAEHGDEAQKAIQEWLLK